MEIEWFLAPPYSWKGESVPLLLAPDLIKLSPSLELVNHARAGEPAPAGKFPGGLSRKRMRNPLKVGKHLNYHGELQI